MKNSVTLNVKGTKENLMTFLDTIKENNIDPDDICGVFIESFFAPLCHKMPASYAQKLRKFPRTGERSS